MAGPLYLGPRRAERLEPGLTADGANLARAPEFLNVSSEQFRRCSVEPTAPIESATQPAACTTPRYTTMAAMPTSRILRPCLRSTTAEAAWSLWASLAQCTHKPSVARFSTSPALCKKDNNKIRGLSAVRGTGLRPRQTLSVKQKDFENQQLPTPVEIATTVKGTQDHGLWDFFKDQKLLQTPVEIQQHGTQQLQTRECVNG